VPDRNLEKILYAEPLNQFQELVLLALKEIGGFKVKVTDSGKETLSAAAEYQPDLILLNESLDDIDGISIFIELKKDPNLKNIPVMLLTNDTTDRSADTYKQMGFTGIISKPFDPVELSGNINQIWEQMHG
jgi:two-component system, OmpR family, response regulator